MDELFLLPHATIALPRAYWLSKQLSTQVMLIEPSKSEFDRVLKSMKHRKANDFDMDIINDLYSKDCHVIPHRRYNLVSGEFRKLDQHEAYLGSAKEEWDPTKIINETKYIHFSDWPYPKPWIMPTHDDDRKLKPKCKALASGEVDCRDRDVWRWIYKDFKSRRKV
jgi:alpha-N-acetylglucosamine transferase